MCTCIHHIHAIELQHDFSDSVFSSGVGEVLRFGLKGGCSALMGRFLTRNPLTLFPFFTKKLLNMGQLF